MEQKTIKLGENTRNGWQNAYNDINDIKERRIFTVDAEIDTIMQDMLSLRYFFALAKRLANDDIISEAYPLKLNIRAEQQNKNENQEFRLRRFFENWKEIPYIRILWNGSELSPAKWEYSSIFPCCTVDADSKGKRGYWLLNQVFYQVETEKNVGDNRFVEYANALLSHLKNPDCYKGTTDNNLQKGDREKIVQELTRHFNRHLGDMTILSQIIWTFFLCSFLEDKTLFWKKKTENDASEVGISESLLVKSRFDAITYANGIYNAIENACLYSELKQAWFGFRVHRASRSAPPSEHLKEAQTREMLYRQYQNCIDNKSDKSGKSNRGSFGNNDCRFYFEFFVLDNAGAGHGILDTYNDRLFYWKWDKVYNHLMRKKEAATDETEKRRIDEAIHKLPKNRSEELDAENWTQLLQDAGLRNLRKYLEKLEEIFIIKPRINRTEDLIEDVTEHFGLKMLKNIVQVSRGYLKGITSNTELSTGVITVECYPENPKKPPQDREEETLFTEWNVIVPVTNEWEIANTETAAEQIGENYFGESIQAPPKSLVYLSNSAIFRCCNLGEEHLAKVKKETITQINDNISKGLSLSRERNGFSLFKINTVKPAEIELFCKALFASIVKRYQPGTATRFALLMQNIDAVLEVVRFFAVFYANGGSDKMENVQIALCTKSDLYVDAITVNFLLMGSDKQRALDSARKYVYNHTENIAEHIPLLKHLSALMTPSTADTAKGKKPKTKEPVPYTDVFPFDLYLPQEIPADESSREPVVVELKENAGESWFNYRIGKILNSDLRNNEFGCKLDDLHVRIGSKIHLNCFFEAELLFHNVGITSRFAYLIAQDLLYGSGILNDGQSVLLLGYEKYSAPLLLQIEYWLKNYQRFPRVYTAVVYDHETKDEVKLAPYFNVNEKRENGDSLSVQSVVILPVATTLSTAYKVFNTAKKKLPGFFSGDMVDGVHLESRSLTADKYYSIVLVNSDLVQETEGRSEITRRYWESIYRPNREVVVSPERKRMKSPPSVRYFIPADGKWHDPMQCPICKDKWNNLTPIVDTRKTDAKPKTIVTLYGDQYRKHQLTATGLKKDDDSGRIHKLYGNVLYSHLHERSNHFQFYLDYQSIYAENEAEIDSLLSNIKLDREAFNVVISPVQIRNSLFVRSVLNNAFVGSARYVCFDPDNTYREDFRSRFSYIAEDFKRMKRGSVKAKIHFHFVDCSIVTGTTINRVRSLLQMLLAQAGIDTDDIVLFDHVFLLVNRSNYDTINYYVQNPYTDLIMYIQFNIPSYNTQRDYCPACHLREKYELMEKCSSTLELSREFKKLISKHEKRSKEEYEQWQRENIFERHSYLSWLFLWLYAFVPEDSEKSKLLTPLAEGDLEGKADLREKLLSDAMKLRKYLMARELPPEMLPNQQDKSQQNKDWVSNYLRVMVQLKIKDIEPETKDIEPETKGLEPIEKEDKLETKEEYREIVLRLFREEIIPVRNYMRIFALHTMYGIAQKASSSSEDIRRGSFRRAILQGISDKISIVGEGSESDSLMRYSIACKAEWLISFIKVLSREQFSNYYDYRQAVAGILSDILNLMNQCVAEINGRGSGKKKNAKDYRAVGKNLISEDEKWKTLVSFIKDIVEGSKEPLLCALYFYQIYMTVFHRLSDMQILSVTDAEWVNHMVNMYRLVNAVQDGLLQEKYSRLVDLVERGKKPTFQSVPLIEIPDFYRMLLRYQKAIKVATMSSGDAIPSIKLADTYRELVGNNHRFDGQSKNWFLSCTKYLYLENTQMMYEGMRNLNSLIQAQEGLEKENKYPPAYRYMDKIREKLGKKVREILLDCYSNIDGVSKREDILHQNIMASFCEFWHCSTDEPTVGADEGSDKHLQITHMLQYYRLLERLIEPNLEVRPDDLPYFYEELCRTICGITSFKMCYIAYSCDGEYPSIIAQSGYYSAYDDDGSILTSSVVERIVRLSKYGQDDTTDSSEALSYKHWEIIKGITVLLGYSIPEDKPKQTPIECEGFKLEDEKPEKSTEYDYLVLGLPIETGKTFYIILQSHSKEEVLKKESEELNVIWMRSLRKARDVLFMRRSLFEALKRDYTTLINLRFDCSYIRPAMDQRKPEKKGKKSTPQKKDYKPSIMHISDLHMTGAEGENILKITHDTIQKTLTSAECIPDLLVVSGDLVESKNSDANTAQQRYNEAAKLLRGIACSLWEDKEGYLPHDWRRRIVICTGNHDYATMNQYRPNMQHRALTAALPVIGESGTMAKFSYYVDFLIRFLDVPADEFLRNDLNEVREYRNLNLKCLVLNMSSAAMSSRSNKLGVNRDILRKVLSRKIWAGTGDGVSFRSPMVFKICVGHYSPKYTPNYGLDAYGALPGWEWDATRESVCQINRLVIKFWYATMEEITSRIRQIDKASEKGTPKPCDTPQPDISKEQGDSKEANEGENTDKTENEKAPAQSNACCFLLGIEQLDKAMACLENDGDKELLSDCARKFYTELENAMKDYTSAQSLCKAMRNAELYRIMDRYRKWIKNGRPATDEEIVDLLHNVTEAQIMGKRDADELRVITKLITKAGNIDVFFAGHIHEFWEWHKNNTNNCCDDSASKSETDDIEDIKNILVSSKFYNSAKNHIYGYLLKEMDCEKLQKIGTDEKGKPLV